VEYIKMGIREYSSMQGKKKLYEDLSRGSRRVSVDTSGTPVMAGKVDRRKDAVAKTTTKKDSRKTKTAKFGVGPSKTIMHKGRSMLNVTADQLKKTGLTQEEYMKAWNKTGKRPTKATTTARRGNAVPGGRSGDKTPRIDAPIHTTLKRQILSKKPAMTKTEARKAGITTGPREMTKAEARKAKITGPKEMTKAEARKARITGPREMTKAEARKAKITGPREMTKAEARKARITGPKEMTKAEARKAKITGPREMTKAEARKAGITGPKKVTGSAYLRRRQKEIKSRKLSGGGIIRGTRAQVRGRTFKGVF
jgi:purine nucleoside phosphorylase